MCRVFSVSRSGYYAYVSRMELPSKDLPLAEKIRECQDKCCKTYGYRRVHIRLERKGIHHNPKTILRVMQKYNLLSVVSGLQIFHTSRQSRGKINALKTRAPLTCLCFYAIYGLRDESHRNGLHLSKIT